MAPRRSPSWCRPWRPPRPSWGSTSWWRRPTMKGGWSDCCTPRPTRPARSCSMPEPGRTTQSRFGTRRPWSTSRWSRCTCPTSVPGRSFGGTACWPRWPPGGLPASGWTPTGWPCGPLPRRPTGRTADRVPFEHGDRRDRVRAALAGLDADAVLVTRLVNVYYLTGFTGSNGALLILAGGGACLATDGRYRTQSAAQAPDVDRVIDRAVAGALAKRAVLAGVGRLAFEAHDVTVEQHGLLLAAAEPASLVSLGRVVEELRMVKDDVEVALLRAACAIADRALADVLPHIAPGRTERAVAAELEARMRVYGGDGAAFETICAAGPNSAVPHHRPTDRVIAAGDFVTLDFGARLAGYHSDMTRTGVVGRAADWQRDIYPLVAAAQVAGRAALAVGADVQAVDAAARDMIVTAGYGEQFPHGLGHGVGLEIHEAPTLGTTATGVLAASVPVTVEPGVYLPGRGGVRIEDTLVVRPNGPELLTTAPRELREL